MNGFMWAVFYLSEEGEQIKRIVVDHQIRKTQTIIETVQTRLEGVKNNASEFDGITLWQNWETRWRHISVYASKCLGHERSFFFGISCYSSMAAGNLMQREEQDEFRKQEKYVPSDQPGRGPAENNLNNSQTTQRLPATGESPSVATAAGDLMQSSQ